MSSLVFLPQLEDDTLGVRCLFSSYSLKNHKPSKILPNLYINSSKDIKHRNWNLSLTHTPFSLHTKPSFHKDPFLVLISHTQSTQRKFISVCEGHLISMNFPPRNCKGYYAYSSRVGGKLGSVYVYHDISKYQGKRFTCQQHL